MIVLYGALKKRFGTTIDCDVRSVDELIRAADANRPGFRKAIDKDRYYSIKRGSTLKNSKVVSEQEVDMIFSDTTWHILPLPIGYGGNGFLGAILGAIMIVVGFVYGQPWLMQMGIGIALGGVAAMLSPSPGVNNYTDREDPDSRPSYLFNGPLNRTEPGGAVPLVYGKDVFVGSIFVSGGLNIGDIPVSVPAV